MIKKGTSNKDILDCIPSFTLEEIETLRQQSLQNKE
jgi:hypothetical protein